MWFAIALAVLFLTTAQASYWRNGSETSLAMLHDQVATTRCVREAVMISDYYNRTRVFDDCTQPILEGAIDTIVTWARSDIYWPLSIEELTTRTAQLQLLEEFLTDRDISITKFLQAADWHDAMDWPDPEPLFRRPKLYSVSGCDCYIPSPLEYETWSAMQAVQTMDGDTLVDWRDVLLGLFHTCYDKTYEIQPVLHTLDFFSRLRRVLCVRCLDDRFREDRLRDVFIRKCMIDLNLLRLSPDELYALIFREIVHVTHI